MKLRYYNISEDEGPNRMRYSKQEWFKTRQEMNEVFSDIPEALSNTLEVLDKVEIYRHILHHCLKRT